MSEKCVVCHEIAVDCFVNPYNPKDRSPYCSKHLQAISKGFQNFLILKNQIESEKVESES